MTTMITGSQINWQRCQVLVTGGASFIGSHLVVLLTICRAEGSRISMQFKARLSSSKATFWNPILRLSHLRVAKLCSIWRQITGGGGILLPILPTASTTWPSTTQYSAVLLQMASRESPSRVRPVFTPRTSRPARCSCERIWSPSRNEAVCSLMKNMAGPS